MDSNHEVIMKFMKLIDRMKFEEDEEEEDENPEFCRTMELFDCRGYVPYNCATFWQEIPVNTIKKLTDVEIECQLKKMLTFFLLKKYHRETMKCAVHLATQLRDPKDTSQLLINPALFDPKQVSENIIGNIDLDVPEIITGKSLKLYNQMVDEIHMKSAYIWGPALAAVLMTAEKRSAASVLRKLRNLGEKLSFAYCNDNVSFPSMSDRSTWLEFVEPIAANKVCIVQALRNTVQLGYVMAYHQENTSPQTRNILDFLSLQALRLSGMPLISLTLEICEHFKCSPDDLQRVTNNYYSSRLWKTFDKVAKKYLQPAYEKTDPYWRYAKGFSTYVFPLVAYRQSYHLCQILALIKDCISGANRDPKLSSVYKRLHENRKYYVYPVPKEDGALAEAIYHQLKQEFPVSV